MTDRLLTVREVADRVGVHSETVLRWIRRGELPAIRLPGGALRIRESHFDRWLDERATPRRGVQPPRRTPPVGTLTTATLRGATATEDEE